MVNSNSNILTNLFLYIILPITPIIIIIVLIILRKSQKLSIKKKSLLFLKTLGIIFTFYSLYTFIWSILELIPLKKYNILKESKLPIFLWIILPIIPTIVAYVIWSKYKQIKEAGDKNAKKTSFN